MVRIPAEYQEVEYIESTGEQYIVTDVMPAQNLSFHCKYRPNSNTGPGYGNAFGSRKSSTNREFQLSAYKGGCVGIGTRNVTGHINVNEINVIDFDGETTVTINGIECSIVTSEDQHDMPICLFSISENVSVGIQKQAGRIYELSFSNVANFIPCYRKLDGEIGMYNTVTGTFYTKRGTGTFLKGNDVTYDPISLLETRRKILLNTPHIESASGSIATFNTDLSTNLTDMKIHFHPVQAGSGDPSPDNVRPITGWTGLTVYHSGSDRTTPLEIPISFPQTIYGGYVDLVKGEVVEEWHKWVEDGSRAPSYWIWEQDSTNNVYTALFPALPSEYRHNADFGYIEKVKCTTRKYVGINNSQARLSSNIISLYRSARSASFAYSFTGAEFADMTKADLQAYLAENPIEAVYILQTPIHHTLTPQVIKTLKGINNIWSNANGNIEVKFWKH